MVDDLKRWNVTNPFAGAFAAHESSAVRQRLNKLLRTLAKRLEASAVHGISPGTPRNHDLRPHTARRSCANSRVYMYTRKQDEIHVTQRLATSRGRSDSDYLQVLL